MIFPDLPEPWQARRIYDGGVYVGLPKHDGMVCDIPASVHQEDIARLIAAAPEMLRVLEQITEDMEIDVAISVPTWQALKRILADIEKPIPKLSAQTIADM